MKRASVIKLLVVRALFGALFGFVLLASQRLEWGAVFAAFGNYALADGGFAALLAGGSVALSPSVGGRWQRSLVPGLVACDAIVRVGAGAVIRGWPGIPYFPVTSVLYLGTIGVLTVWVSVVELGVLAAAERRERWPAHSAVLSRVALIVAGAVPMLLLGLKLVIAPPSSASGLRLLFAGYMVATSCGLAIAAVRSEADARRRMQRPALFVLSNTRRRAAVVI